MIEGWIFWTVVTAFVAAGAVAFRIHQRRVARLVEATSRERSEADRRLRGAAEARRNELEQADATHHQTVSKLRADHAKQVAQYEDLAQTAKRDAKLYQDAALKSIKWERASRRIIMDACKNLPLDGVLATNVIFICADNETGDTFPAQLDHVLVTDSFAMVIESKNWQGAVFDGIRPSKKHEALGKLIDESVLGRNFAVQLLLDEQDGPTVRVHTASRAPRLQVLKQAVRLKHELRKSTPALSWVHTCVLYSHRDAIVYAPTNAPVGEQEGTPVVSNTQALKDLLSKVDNYESQHGTRLPVRSLGGSLNLMSSDMYGFGAYADTWRSRLPL